MALTLCPPCSGSGLPDGKRVFGVLEQPQCRLCAGHGEVTEDVLEAFWACVIEYRFLYQPAKCIGEVAGWRH